MSEPVSTPKGSALELHDVITHRAAWREALEKCRDRANPPTHDTDDPSYWRHELEVFDRTFDALCSLLAARKGQGEWRDIRSAPKDGTPFLAYRAKSRRAEVVRWVAPYEKAGVAFGGEFVKAASGWQLDVIWELHTHWMPLPPPSKQEEGS